MPILRIEITEFLVLVLVLSKVDTHEGVLLSKITDLRIVAQGLTMLLSTLEHLACWITYHNFVYYLQLGALPCADKWRVWSLARCRLVMR